MGSEWNKYRLQDLDIKFEDGDRSSKYPKATEFLSVGNHPFINTKNLSDGQLDLTEVNFISNIKFDEIKKGRVNPDDILISTRGSKLGKVAFYRDHKWKQPLINAQLLILRSNDERLDPEFLYFLLNSNKGQAQIEMLKSGSAQPQLPVRDLKKFEIYVPNVVIQKQIVTLGRILDKKIALNRQINQTLEQMAQTLFKSWFVDFDPVIDNALDAIANGQNIEIPESLAKRFEARKAVRESEGFEPLPADIRQLFPCEFEGSELGFVPKGWRYSELSEITSELRRGISPKYLEEGGVQVINQKCIRNHEVNFSLCRRNNTELRKVEGRELFVGDVLVNSTGMGTLGRIAQVTYLPEKTVVDSHVTVVRIIQGKCPVYTFGQLMLANERRIEALGEGSTGQTELSRKVLSEQKILLPLYEVAKYIENMFKASAKKKFNNTKEIIELTKLRDTLLPKLISGELRLDSLQGETLQQAVIAE